MTRCWPARPLCRPTSWTSATSIVAIINGRRKELRIVGVAFSPEYVFQIKPGDMLPDPRHFGILWMEHEALSTAYDMEGAFNDVAISLTHGVSEAGGDPPHRLVAGAVRRPRRLSPARTSSRTCFWRAIFKGSARAGLIAPTIFLCVAAFLLNVVLTRLTSLQREQIAALKAFGYTNFQIAWHYMKFVLLITIGRRTVGHGRRDVAGPRLHQVVPARVPVSGTGVSSAAKRGGQCGVGRRRRGDCRCVRRDCAGGPPAAGRGHAARSRRPAIGLRSWSASAWGGWCRMWPAWCCGNWSATLSRRRSHCWRFRCPWRSSSWATSCATRSTK